MKKLFILGMIAILPKILFSQTWLDSLGISQIIEKRLENIEKEINPIQIIDELENYLQHPISINQASAKDLQFGGLIPLSEANKITAHREAFGAFVSLYELQSIENLSKETILILQAFCKLDYSPKSHSKNLLQMLNKSQIQLMNYHKVELEKRKGFAIADTISPKSKNKVNHYVGKPLKSNFRFRGQYFGKIKFGFNLENDAGEAHISKPIDYISAHFSLSNYGNIQRLCIGDYGANFGQGLTLGTNYAMGKTALVMGTKRDYKGFQSYRSMAETGFLRGLAGTFQLKNWYPSFFISHKKRDINGLKENSFTSFNSSGYHRTLAELEGQDGLKTWLMGGGIAFRKTYFDLGLIVLARKWNKTMQKGSHPYQKFHFSGNGYKKAGMYFDFGKRNINSFGELSVGNNGGKSCLLGNNLALNDWLSYSFIYRYYDPSFIPYQSNSFAENSQSLNEKGLYQSIEINLNKYIHFSSFVDIFKHPWLSYQKDAPGKGNELFTEFKYNSSKQNLIYIRYRLKQEDFNVQRSNKKTAFLGAKKINLWRIHAQRDLSKQILMAARFVQKTVDFDGRKNLGSLLFQELRWQSINQKWKIGSRMALFHISHFDARISAFEQVPLYDYPIYTYYNEGWRFYLLGQWRINSKLNLWIKYAKTFYSNIQKENKESPYHTNAPTSFGTDLSSITDNQIRQISLQIKYKP